MTYPETARAQKQTGPNSQPAISDHTIPAHAHASEAALHAEDQGYHKGLKPRQIQMIAIGGAIGTGLFMGAGGRLAAAGPALDHQLCSLRLLRLPDPARPRRTRDAPAVVGLVRLLRPRILRREGRVRHRLAVLAELGHDRDRGHHRRRAVHELLQKYWAPIADVPQWAWALIALVLVLGLNLISVKVFGELEFWFALIKVVALVSFLLVGTYFVIFGTPVDGQEVGFSLIADNGGMFPNGLLPADRPDAGRACSPTPRSS